MKKYLLAFLIWIMIIPIAILNGGFRQYVLVKLGGFAMPISGIILSVCIFVVAYFTIPKIKNCAKKDYIIFGIMWFILKNLFKFFLLNFHFRSTTKLHNSIIQDFVKKSTQNVKNLSKIF